MKELFDFSKKEISGMLVLIAILTLLLIINFSIDYLPSDNTKYDFRSFEAAIDSLNNSKQSIVKTKYIEQFVPKNKISPVEKVKILINLNKADTTELRTLRGIGRVYSNRIIKYRNLLGGFADKKQLLEVYGINQDLFNSVASQIFVKDAKLIKINLNTANYKTIIRHPYINKSMTKKILNKQPNNTIFDLEKDSTISNVLLKKLKPYIEE